MAGLDMHVVKRHMHGLVSVDAFAGPGISEIPHVDKHGYACKCRSNVSIYVVFDINQLLIDF